jgi:hypothetical protein
MAYARNIVLHSSAGYQPRLDDLVEEFMRDSVAVVAVVGEECEKIEDIIDELVVGPQGRDYSGRDDFMITTSHPDESVDEVVAFVRSWRAASQGDIQVVDL